LDPYAKGTLSLFKKALIAYQFKISVLLQTSIYLNTFSALLHSTNSLSVA